MFTPLRRHLLASLSGVLALGVLPPARAATRPLRAVALQVAPFGMLDAQGRPGGIFVDVFRLLEKEAGLQVEISVAPYARAMAMLRSGEADLLLATSSVPIAQLAEPMGMLWQVDVMAIGRAGLALDSERDLRGLRVGIVRGADYGVPFLDGDNFTRHDTRDQLQAIRLLVEKRIDASVGTRLAIQYAIHVQGLRREQLGSMVRIQTREVHLHLSKRRADPELESRLRRAVEALRSSGRIDALVTSYAGGLG